MKSNEYRRMEQYIKGITRHIEDIERRKALCTTEQGIAKKDKEIADCKARREACICTLKRLEACA